MAMLQMQRINIYALKKDRKPILELLQRCGVVEINDILEEDNVFQRIDVSKYKSAFEHNINEVGDAVEILGRYVPIKKSIFSSLNGRKEITISDYDSFKDKYEQTMKTANLIIAYAKKVAELKIEIQKLETQCDILEPWRGLDIPLGFTGTKFTKGYLGTIPKEWTAQAVEAVLEEYMPLYVEIMSASKDQTCMFVLCTRDKANQVYNKLRSLEFVQPGITPDKAPAEQLAQLDGQITELNSLITENEEKIKAFAEFREDLLLLQDYERMRSEKYEVIGKLSQSRNVFVLTGYIPEKEIDALAGSLTKDYLVGIETEKPSEEEDVPVLLHNNAFARPLEWVVDGFSLPGKGEIDPTMMMALFYYVLFGIMLADAGYGFLMTAACAFCLIKYGRTMELSTKNFLSMFLYCGISTTFWGIMFGSYFGDLIDVVATTFFEASNTPIIPPLWFFPVNKPMQMLVFSIVMGLIHLLTGLGVKIYQLFKQKEYLAILYDALSWFVLIVSCTILLMSMEMMKAIIGPSVNIPPHIAKGAAILAVIASVIIILTNGRESRNPFKRFLKGAYALYGITGYLSDVLSYSRLLALGLASGIIGNVVNKMASMTAGSLIGLIPFIIIVVAGHALNIAINALGAYVHTNRLQYVEFFGKFYEGGGRSFQPFSMNTKYYKVKEKTK